MTSKIEYVEGKEKPCLLMAHQQIKTTYSPIKPGVKKPALTCYTKRKITLDFHSISIRRNEREWKRQDTFGWSETLVMSWSRTSVQVMKKMLRRQDGYGAYQMYIIMIPTMHIKYAAVAVNIT